MDTRRLFSTRNYPVALNGRFLKREWLVSGNVTARDRP